MKDLEYRFAALEARGRENLRERIERRAGDWRPWDVGAKNLRERIESWLVGLVIVPTDTVGIYESTREN